MKAAPVDYNIKQIAYNDEDNWQDYTYDNRYLDAISSFFHLQSPCAAAVAIKDKIYVSYNQNITSQNSSTFTLLSHMVSNGGITYTADDLLTMYLLFNADFKDIIAKSRKHVDLTLKYALENFRELKRKLVDHADHKIYKLKLATTPKDEAGKKIQTCIANILSTASTYKLVDNYKAFLEKLYIAKLNDPSQHPQHLLSFTRPIQDSYKLHTYLAEKILICGDKLEIASLDNVHEVHAEYNIAFTFKESVIDQNYIGTSRLSCGYCKAKLLETQHHHRGTHGVCDPKWKLIPGDLSDVKAALKDQIMEVVDLPVQYRKLSHDAIDDKILLLGEDNAIYSLSQFKEAFDKY